MTVERVAALIDRLGSDLTPSQRWRLAEAFEDCLRTRVGVAALAVPTAPEALVRVLWVSPDHFRGTYYVVGEEEAVDRAGAVAQAALERIGAAAVPALQAALRMPSPRVWSPYGTTGATSKLAVLALLGPHLTAADLPLLYALALDRHECAQVRAQAGLLWVWADPDPAVDAMLRSWVASPLDRDYWHLGHWPRVAKVRAVPVLLEALAAANAQLAARAEALLLELGTTARAELAALVRDSDDPALVGRASEVLALIDRGAWREAQTERRAAGRALSVTRAPHDADDRALSPSPRE